MRRPIVALALPGQETEGKNESSWNAQTANQGVVHATTRKVRIHNILVKFCVWRHLLSETLR